jgi:hypothetical protein
MRRSIRRFGAALVAVGLTVGLTTGASAAPPPGEDDVVAKVEAPDAASITLTELYIYAVYYDLFGREVDPAGLATWTGQLNSGTPRRAVADAITSSDEFRSGLIWNAYDQYLDREPDAAGLAHWLQMMRQGMTIQQMISYFLGSPEFYAKAGGTDEGFIYWLYGTVLGRAPAASEVSHWLYLITDLPHRVEPTRDQIALGFLLSTERLSWDLDGEYQWLLGRGLDPSGKQTWVTQIQTGTRYEAVIGSIIASDEYLNYILTWI